jgi:hypothetical protein
LIRIEFELTPNAGHNAPADRRPMFDAMKHRWRRLAAVRSGARFRTHHRDLQQRPSLVRALLVIGCGLLLLAAGLVMLVLPGPGLLVAVIGAALIAGESRVVARLLDRVDLCATRTWRRWRR